MIHSGKTVFCDAIKLILIAVKACFALQLCRMYDCDFIARLIALVMPVVMPAVMPAADSTARPPLG